MIFRLLLLAVLALCSLCAQAAPPWASLNTQRLGQEVLRIVCSGAGPSAGLARKEALNDCWTSAAQVLSSEISVKSLSASSERQAIYQQEVVNHSHVKGLTCNPRKEAMEQSGDQVTVWLLCEFDLSKAKSIQDADGGISSDFAIPAQLPNAMDAPQNPVVSNETVVVTLATIPRCDDIIVMGRGPARILSCHRNPMPVPINPEDNEIVVRAKNHFPKSIFLGPRRETRGYVQVVLQSHH